MTQVLERRGHRGSRNVQAPLWSDGAAKRRWLSVPAGTSLGYTESGHPGFPPGTVLVKHFEMAMDERFPEQRRRLETRFWIVVSDTEQSGRYVAFAEALTRADRFEFPLLRRACCLERRLAGMKLERTATRGRSG
jgi:hypothetical protein